MPKLDRFEVIPALRDDPQTSQVPIVMLTERTDEEDVLDGLSLGVEDYMPKPFSPHELFALPSMLLFEVLGPVIELSGYVVTIVVVALGTLQTGTFPLFLALAVLYGLVLTLGAIALEGSGANRFPGWDDLRRTLVLAGAENVGYRQLQHLWRLEGFREAPTSWSGTSTRAVPTPGGRISRLARPLRSCSPGRTTSLTGSARRRDRSPRPARR